MTGVSFMNRLTHPTIDMSPEGIDEVCGPEPYSKWMQDALDRMPKE